MGCRKAAKGQTALVEDGPRRCVPCPSDALGRSRRNNRAKMPTMMTITPNSRQVWRQPSIGFWSINQGATIPAATKAMLPPAAASPATRPLSRIANHGACSPIIGVRAAPVVIPMSSIATIATRKLADWAKSSIDAPAPIVQMPIIIRLPYRGARVPDAKELPIRSAPETVTRMPAWV